MKPAYYLTTAVQGKTVDWRKPMADPFVTGRLTTRFGWRDRLRILMGRPIVVEVSIDGSPETVEAVLELDDDYLGAYGSERRRAWNERVNAALRERGGLRRCRLGCPAHRCAVARGGQRCQMTR